MLSLNYIEATIALPLQTYLVKVIGVQDHTKTLTLHINNLLVELLFNVSQAIVKIS